MAYSPEVLPLFSDLTSRWCSSFGHCVGTVRSTDSSLLVSGNDFPFWVSWQNGSIEVGKGWQLGGQLLISQNTSTKSVSRLTVEGDGLWKFQNVESFEETGLNMKCTWLG